MDSSSTPAGEPAAPLPPPSLRLGTRCRLVPDGPTASIRGHLARVARPPASPRIPGALDTPRDQSDPPYPPPRCAGGCSLWRLRRFVGYVDINIGASETVRTGETIDWHLQVIAIPHSNTPQPPSNLTS